MKAGHVQRPSSTSAPVLRAQQRDALALEPAQLCSVTINQIAPDTAADKGIEVLPPPCRGRVLGGGNLQAGPRIGMSMS